MMNLIKRQIFLLALFFLLFSNGYSQSLLGENTKWSIGAKVGPNLNISSLGNLNDNLPNKVFFSDIMLGVHVGVTGGYNFTDFLSIKLELMATTQGSNIKFKSDINDEDSPINSDGQLRYYSSSLAVPLLIRYHPIEQFSIDVGGQYSRTMFMRELLDCQSVMLIRYPDNGYKEFDKTSYNKNDFVALVGASYYFKRFLISLRYVHGFNPIISKIMFASEKNKKREYNFNNKNRVVQISIEYKF